MKRFQYTNLFCLVVLLLLGTRHVSAGKRQINPSDKSSIWIQPTHQQTKGLWGFKKGIQVGLDPASIRGLILVYSPYMGQKSGTVINFFAVEPIVSGEWERGFSELEHSDLDGVQGKRIWSSDDASDCNVKDASVAAPGFIGHENGIETLTTYLFVEPFRNGAKVYVRIRFYANNPYEVEISPFRCDDSRDLSNCIITATMGNYARLRTLYLKDGVKSSRQIWPDYAQKAFAPHELIAKEQMIHNKSGLPYLIATPDEKNPQKAHYAEKTPSWWQYQGRVAIQYWYCKTPQRQLQGLVNGRIVYWGDELPIPGGIAFENFELKQPFNQGDHFVFGISPLSAKKFIEQLNKNTQ